MQLEWIFYCITNLSICRLPIICSGSKVNTNQCDTHNTSPHITWCVFGGLIYHPVTCNIKITNFSVSRMACSNCWVIVLSSWGVHWWAWHCCSLGLTPKRVSPPLLLNITLMVYWWCLWWWGCVQYLSWWCLQRRFFQWLCLLQSHIKDCTSNKGSKDRTFSNVAFSNGASKHGTAFEDCAFSNKTS